MKIESTAYGKSELDGYLDELIDHDRRHLADRLEGLSAKLAELGGRVRENPPSEEQQWTAQEILAHIAVLSKFYGMLTYKIGTGAMTELDLLGNVNQRDVVGEQLSKLPPSQLVEMARADHQRTVTYLRQADAKAMRATCVIDGGRSTMTAADFARLPLIAHLDGHLDQLAAALDGASST